MDSRTKVLFRGLRNVRDENAAQEAIEDYDRDEEDEEDSSAIRLEPAHSREPQGQDSEQPVAVARSSSLRQVKAAQRRSARNLRRQQIDRGEEDGPRYKDQVQGHDPRSPTPPAQSTRTSAVVPSSLPPRAALDDTQDLVLGGVVQQMYHVVAGVRQNTVADPVAHGGGGGPRDDGPLAGADCPTPTHNERMESVSSSRLPQASPVYDASVVQDREELEAQMMRRIMANVEEAQVVVPVDAEETRSTTSDRLPPQSSLQTQSKEQQNRRRRRRFLWCGVCLLLAIAIGIAIVLIPCGTGLCLADASPADASSSSSSGPNPTTASSVPPKTWNALEDDLYGYSDIYYRQMDTGMFGTRVSVSSDGTLVLVAYGESQGLLTSRTRRHRELAYVSGSTAAELFECNVTACAKVADVGEDSFGIEGTISTAMSGDGSRIVVEYSSWGQTSLVAYAVDLDSAEPVVSLQAFDIQGDTNHTVALDFTGDRLATLDTQLTGDATIFVYNTAVNEYVPFGNSIVGRADESPTVLSLSSSGSVMAIGSNVNITAVPSCHEDSNLTESEGLTGFKLRVYEMGSEGEVVQLGLEIEGHRNETFTSEEAITLSENGTIVAIGVTSNPEEFCVAGLCCSRFDQGHVRVFRLSSMSDKPRWEAMGNVISGVAGELFGESISLSGDGQTLVVGAALSELNGLGSGRVLVYDFDSASNEWVQSDPALSGNVRSSYGRSVAISKDGDTIVVGAPLDQTKGEFGGAATLYRLE